MDDKPWGSTLREKLPRSVRLRYINWGAKERQQWLAGTSSTLRLDVERRGQALCGGYGDPLSWWRSSLVEPGIKVTVGLVSSKETWLPRSNTLCECFNNVDVGMPLWLTEPPYKSSCHKSLHSLIPPLNFRISYCNLCVPLISRIKS